MRRLLVHESSHGHEQRRRRPRIGAAKGRRVDAVRVVVQFLPRRAEVQQLPLHVAGNGDDGGAELEEARVFLPGPAQRRLVVSIPPVEVHDEGNACRRARLHHAHAAQPVLRQNRVGAPGLEHARQRGTLEPRRQGIPRRQPARQQAHAAQPAGHDRAGAVRATVEQREPIAVKGLHLGGKPLHVRPDEGLRVGKVPVGKGDTNLHSALSLHRCASVGATTSRPYLGTTILTQTTAHMRQPLRTRGPARRVAGCQPTQ